MEGLRKYFGQTFRMSFIFVSILLNCLFFAHLALAQPAIAGEFKVGIIAPLSGPAKIWGLDVSRGVNLAIDDINGRGGIKVNGKAYQVQVIECDDKYKGTEGATAANRLISQSNVKYIFGSISSASIMAFQVITEPNKVLCFINSFSQEVLGPQKPYSFRILMTSKEKSHLLVNALFDHLPNIKTVATFAPQDISGTSVTQHYVDAVGSRAKVVINEYFQRGAEDLYPMITRIKKTNPDLIISCGSPPASVAKFLKQARQLGINGPVLGHSGSVENPIEFVTLADKENTANYYYGIDFNFLDDSPKTKDFMQKYKTKYDLINYGYVAPAFYDAMMALAFAIEKVGSFDTEQVKAFLETEISEYVGIMGPFKFEGKDTYGIDHQRMTSAYFCTFENGTHKILRQLR